MSSEQPIKLVINTESWHYRHYCRIRRLFNIDTPVGKRTSLCPYCQTIAWGSLIYTLSLPFQLIGFIVIKVSRWLYRVAESARLTKLTDFIDATPVGVALSRSTEDLEANAFLTCSAWGVITAMIGFILFGLGMAATFSVEHIYNFIPEIPSLIAQGVYLIGWAFIMALCGIIKGVIWLCAGFWHLAYLISSGSVFALVWLFTAGWLWLAVLKGIIYVSSATAAGVLVAYLAMKFTASDSAQWLIRYIKLKFNGYAEARAAALLRRQKELEEEKPAEPGRSLKSMLVDCWLGFWEVLIACAVGTYRFFVSEKGTICGVKVKSLSPFDVCKTFFWAIKHRVCPIVEFVDSDSFDKPVKVVEG